MRYSRRSRGFALSETITRFTPLGPSAYRTDEEKVEYLHDAVIGIPWAKSVLTQSISASPPWDFQRLYTTLDAAWLHEEKEKEGNKLDQMSSSSAYGKILIPGINYESQTMYGVPRRPGSTSSNPYPRNRGDRDRTNNRDKNGNTRACYNWGSKYHFIKDCPKKIQLTNNVSRILEKTPRSRDVKRILFELCPQTEDALNANDDSESDNSSDSDLDDDEKEDSPAENENHFQRELEPEDF